MDSSEILSLLEYQDLTGSVVFWMLYQTLSFHESVYVLMHDYYEGTDPGFLLGIEGR